MSIRLVGNSGCKLELSIENGIPVVVKSQGSFLDVDFKVLCNLHYHGVNIPEYYEVTPERVKMRYLDGLTIADYIDEDRNLDQLIEFCKFVIDQSFNNSVDKDITTALQDKFLSLDQLVPKELLNFKLHTLYDRLPKQVPCGVSHGDLTLENIIYWNDDFYLIDAHYTLLDSPVFDCAKLRQDSECGWFVRNHSTNLAFDDRIKYVNEKIKSFNNYTQDDNLLIFMLLRVIPYCKNYQDRAWLISKINQLWI
jgi:tRNA A-37 threonylcarbamoyl transferase component Bud32